MSKEYHKPKYKKEFMSEEDELLMVVDQWRQNNRRRFLNVTDWLKIFVKLGC